jgi:glycosyltransferase involved in cell wall biosynthesis
MDSTCKRVIIITTQQGLKNNIVLKPVALLISIFFPPEIGGRATGAWNRALVLQKMGYSVFVLSGFPTYPTGRVSDQKYRGKLFIVEKIESFTVIRLRLLPIEYVGFPRHLIIFLNFVFVSILYYPKIGRITGRINMVYARAPIIFSSIIGFVYSKITGAFFIYEAPDLWPEELVVFETRLSPIIMHVGKILAKMSYSLPQIIITVSERAARLISEKYKPRIQVFGIPTGVDPDKFPRLSKDDSRDYLLEMRILPQALRSKFIVLYSGLISSAQCVENLAYAADLLKHDNEIAFLIVGDGPSKNKLEKIKDDLRLDNFHILSPQRREMMPRIIHAADVCTILLSSEEIFEIALPTKFYEYLACHKPLIGVCNGELAYIIESNCVGYTVEPGDTVRLASIIKLLNDSQEMMQRMEDRSKITLQKFSLDSIARSFLDVLEKEIKRPVNRIEST